ncbi:MAG: tetratricopeptide repeat protein [Proteobacteria bacterium]|nr:tetratricopeptide repeat protein [Pseudomonadota bacterium]
MALGILLLLAYPPPEGHSSPFFSAAAGPILLASTVGFFSGPLSLIAGIVAFRQIKKRKGEEKGKFLAWIGVVFGGVHVAFYVLLFVIFLATTRHSGLNDAEKCVEGTGDPDLQIDYCTRAIDSGDLSNEKLAHTFNNRGEAYDRKGEYDRAIADYDQAIRLKPDYALAFNDRGVAYYRKGEYDRAIADFDQAIRLKPDYALAFNNRGSAYDDKGDHDRVIADYDRAIADFTQAIRLDTLEGPRKAWPFNNRGNSYRAKGQYDRAIADFDRAIRLNPDYAIAFNNRGLAYDDKGQHDRAIADYDEAIRLKPDYAIALNNLAGVLATAPDARLRDGPRAVRLAEKAVSLLDDAHTRDHLAAAYAEAGRFRDAVNAQERAVSIARAEGSSASDIADMEDRLRLYRQGRPYREKR